MEPRPHVPGERRSLATDTPDPLDPPATQPPRKPYTAPLLTRHGAIMTLTERPPGSVLV